MELLVSVRNPQEACAAMAGGAGVIDIKEPSRGSLGRADAAVMPAILDAVQGSRPVSAALGELLQTEGEIIPPPASRLDYVKWGLAGAAGSTAWQDRLLRSREHLLRVAPQCRLVVTSYADAQRACSPHPEEVRRFACRERFAVLLIDTWRKDGSTLLDWMADSQLTETVAECRSVGVSVALAGSLGMREIESVMPLRPDWIAVRGAVCKSHDRTADVDAALVRRLADLLASVEGGEW